MENQVEEVKQKLDIVNVISKYLPLKKRGRHFVANCPFHQEKTPSFIVSPELQIFKCFGCGKAGDVFSFVQEYEHIDFKDALDQLASQAGVTLVKSQQLAQSEHRHQRLIEINQFCARFYHHLLTVHPLGKTALDYVVSRGIKPDTIKTFNIGYSPANPQLIYKYLHQKGFSDQELIATGTFGRSQYHPGQFYDRFADRLVFPLSDFRGRILGFSGRILPTSTRPNQAKYINSPETDIYHKSRLLYGLHLSKEAIRQQNSVLIVEGEFDMISPYQSGIINVVALKGTAFTQEQLQLLRRYTDTVILGLDSDFAGNAAAARSIQLADELGFDLQVLDLGDQYKDPDEAVTADPDFFKNQLKNPIPVWDFIIHSSIKKSDIDTPKGKKEVLSAVLPFLSKISNTVIRYDYYRLLANLLGADESALRQEAAKYEKSSSPPLPPPPAPPASSLSAPKVSPLEEHFLVLIFSTQKPAQVAKKYAETLNNLSAHVFRPIIDQLLSQDDFNPKDFQSALPEEIRPAFASIYLKATSLDFEARRRSFEIRKTSNLILSQILKSKISETSEKIAKSEASGNQDQLNQLEKDYNLLLSRLSKIQSQKL